MTPIEGFGLRVPGLMLSAYARSGMIDHQLLSFENFAKLFEDLFAGGARLDPAAFGKPDARPTIRDALTSATFVDGHSEPIGDLMTEFDFTQAPLPPLVMNTHIPAAIFTFCAGKQNPTTICTQPTVSLKWNAIVGTDLASPFTYHVTRDGVALANCAGTATTCSDKPGSGAHFYRVFSVDKNGVVSAPSAASEADEP